jgi:hypothetical protein
MKTTSVRQRNRLSKPRFAAHTIALVTALCALAFANFAAADTINFNVASGDWNVASNWDAVPERVPTSADDATMAVSQVQDVTIAVANSAVAQSITMGNPSGLAKSGTLTVFGTLNVTSNMVVATEGGNNSWISCTVTQEPGSTVTVGNILYIGNGTHVNGYYNLANNATLNVKEVRIAESYDGNGTLNIGIGAQVTASSDVAILNTSGNGARRPGYINQSDKSTVSVGGNLGVGSGGTFSDGWYTMGTNAVATVGANLNIGTGYGSSGTFTIGAGSTVTVEGAVSVGTGSGGSSGAINVNVGPAASGLVLNGSSVSVGSGSIDITFTEDPLDALLGSALTHTDILYGLMWAGDHETTLTNLDTKLTWDDTTNLTGDFYDAVSIFYDSGTDATYVGFYISIIPEPGSFALLTLGTAWLLNRHRGRSTTGIPACRPAA